MEWRTAIVLASMALGGCNLSPFVCTDDSSCSQQDQGRCESNGACSYPDTDCDSGRRYSTYGPTAEGLCVPDEDSTTTELDGTSQTSTSTTGRVTTTLDASTGTTTGSTGDAESSSTGDVPDACGGCSGLGSCVLVDGDPTCACDPGWTMVGLECLEDPCATETCYFVDSVEGNDEGPGSREEPWQTRARALMHLGEALPGDHVLFRRGRTFGGDAVGTISAEGTSAAPIVIGAYGSPDDAAPLLTELSVRLSNAEHVVIRDLSIRGSGSSPCLFVEASGYVTLRDLEVFECGVRGIRVSGGSHHGVVFRNDVHDVGNRVGIFVSDTTWSVPVPTVLGEHHWIAGNTIRNNGEFGIEAVFRPTNHEPGDVGDLKVVDNQVSGTQVGGVAIQSPAGWVIGNVVLGAVDPGIEYNGAIVAREGGTWAHVRANVAAGSNGALTIHGDGLVEKNSVFQAGGANSTLRLASGLSGARVVDNLVYADTVEHARGTADAFAALGALDRNVYAAIAEGACAFNVGGEGTDFAGWQAATAADATSRCEVVPGLSAPASASAPVGPDFFLEIAPDGDWEGCGDVGAVSCDGERRPLVFLPSDDVDENGGRGWEGPLIIQQHYPLER